MIHPPLPDWWWNDRWFCWVLQKLLQLQSLSCYYGDGAHRSSCAHQHPQMRDQSTCTTMTHCWLSLIHCIVPAAVVCWLCSVPNTHLMLPGGCTLLLGVAVLMDTVEQLSQHQQSLLPADKGEWERGKEGGGSEGGRDQRRILEHRGITITPIVSTFSHADCFWQSLPLPVHLLS